MKKKRGKLLTQWRTTNDLLQKQAADILEVNLRTYQNWEEGVNQPNDLAWAELERRMTNHTKS